MLELAEVFTFFETLEAGLEGLAAMARRAEARIRHHYRVERELADRLRALLLRTGFRKVRFYSGARGVYARMPFALLRAAESFLGLLPYRLRRRLAELAPARALLGLYVEALK